MRPDIRIALRCLAGIALAFAASPIASPASPPVALPAFRASIDDTTISGISAGGYMAVQFAVAHANIVRGVGVIAAGPYYCAHGNVAQALGACMTGTPDAAVSIATAKAWAAIGFIDPVAALAKQRVWLFTGSRDTVVQSTVVASLESFYAAFVPRAQIRAVRDVAAGHAFVTDQQGGSCGETGPEYLANCGFDSAGELFRHLLGKLEPRAKKISGKLIEFDQREFSEPGRPPGLAATGYAYVPAACAGGHCRIHVALHGCRQDASLVGDAFYSRAGYNAWADSNRIIALYPQVAASLFMPSNPQGCWDWWGYTGADYAQKSGPQIHAIRAMLNRLAAEGTNKGAQVK
jgi:poly(3-hydroxybutyrate) depolymerase